MLEAELNARQSLEPSAAVVARSTNPLLVLLDQITDEAVRQAIRSVVFEVLYVLYIVVLLNCASFVLSLFCVLLLTFVCVVHICCQHLFFCCNVSSFLAAE